MNEDFNNSKDKDNSGFAIIAGIKSVSIHSGEISFSIKDKEIVEKRGAFLSEEFDRLKNKVPDDKKDSNYLESEEWLDLRIKAWEAAQRTRHNEKIRHFAKILVGAIQIQDRKANSPEDYLNVLIELSEQEFEVAKAIYLESKPWKRFEGDRTQKRTLVLKLPKDPWEVLGGHCPSILEEDLPFILTRLLKTGLFEIYGTTTSMDYPGGAEYVVTKTCSKIMHYLKEKWDDE
jgi:hypothetical protein